MELKVSGAGGIELTPVKKQFTLQELVGGITRCNRHHATDWGRPVGEEVW
jgi:antitoxin component of MazEF toxin-antitoxin module